MKIEKISENQVKIILNKADLTERNMELTELSYGSDKTRELFREMMEQALVECDFNTDSTPLIIEAIPVSHESIMIIVTKAAVNDDSDNKSGFIPKPKEQRRQRQSSDESNEETSVSDVSIFTFKTLDEIIDVAVRINEHFDGGSSVYRIEKKYYLALDGGSAHDARAKKDLEYILMDYAQKINPSPMSKIYLAEHGEAIILEDAVNVLATYFNI